MEIPMTLRICSIFLCLLVTTACGSSETESPTPNFPASSTEPSEQNSSSNTAPESDAEDTTSAGTNTDLDSNETSTETGSETEAETETTEPLDLASLDLYGTVPPSALEAPTFSATNRNGEPRNRDDLIGQPTVVWFFPMASTPG